MTEVYADYAISGGSMARPSFADLIADARERQFDLVLAESLDRLSRDQEHIAGFFKQLRFAGVGLMTVVEGEINELHIGLKGTMSALYLKDLAQKTHRGLEGRVRAGHSGGGLTYGYRVPRALGADGLSIKGVLKIEETEANVVRGIFPEYVAGRSPRAIAVDLNQRGIAGPRAGKWSASGGCRYPAGRIARAGTRPS